MSGAGQVLHLFKEEEDRVQFDYLCTMSRRL